MPEPAQPKPLTNNQLDELKSLRSTKSMDKAMIAQLRADLESSRTELEEKNRQISMWCEQSTDQMKIFGEERAETVEHERRERRESEVFIREMSRGQAQIIQTAVQGNGGHGHQYAGAVPGYAPLAGPQQMYQCGYAHAPPAAPQQVYPSSSSSGRSRSSSSDRRSRSRGRSKRRKQDRRR